MRGKAMALAAALAVVAGAAWGWSEPAKGSAERQAILDAIRPIAEWDIGGPVIFVVETLRVEGDKAFAVLEPKNPDGSEIDLARIALVARDGIDAENLDGVRIDALFTRSGGQWVAVLHQIGATDAWYSWPPICAQWRAVLGPAVCP
jgi:hypothetical protein